LIMHFILADGLEVGTINGEAVPRIGETVTVETEASKSQFRVSNVNFSFPIGQRLVPRFFMDTVTITVVPIEAEEEAGEHILSPEMVALLDQVTADFHRNGGVTAETTATIRKLAGTA
jgi:hypothetical protein